MSLSRTLALAGIVCLTTATAAAQAPTARQVLEQSAAAMGGLARLQGLDNLVMTGFGEYLNQQGGSAPSPDPRAPLKWTVAVDAERIFDLRNERALNRDRRGSLFPFAIERPWDRSNQVQTGVAALDHPVPALLEALDAETRLGPVSVEDGRTVVQFTIQQGATLWLAVDPADQAAGLGALDRPEHDARRHHDDDVFHGLPAVRRLAASRGYHGADGLARSDVDELPGGFVSHDATDLPEFPAPTPRPTGERRAVATKLADKVWDVRIPRAVTAAPSSSSPITSSCSRPITTKPTASRASM